ncbi:MAG: DUF218 domain-containing protein [Eubacterium sp.]|nr:DUF218 domain-containing protein [Eubacterium sp.]
MKKSRKKDKHLPKWLKRTFFAFVIAGITGVLLITELNLWVMGSASSLIYDITSQGEAYTEENPYKFSESHDCIIVLGAGLRDDKPSPMLKDRLEKGISLYKAGAAPKLLMSGDHGRTGYNEVQVMKQYAIDAGVPSEDIFMDHAGFSTYESMIRARDIFGVTSPIVVTQKYHLYRAVYIGKSLGIPCLGVATDDFAYGGQFYRSLRECIARCKDVLTTQLGTPPTYGGEQISISGNGNITND